MRFLFPSVARHLLASWKRSTAVDLDVFVMAVGGVAAEKADRLDGSKPPHTEKSPSETCTVEREDRCHRSILEDDVMLELEQRRSTRRQQAQSTVTTSWLFLDQTAGQQSVSISEDDIRLVIEHAGKSTAKFIEIRAKDTPVEDLPESGFNAWRRAVHAEMDPKIVQELSDQNKKIHQPALRQFADLKRCYQTVSSAELERGFLYDAIVRVRTDAFFWSDAPPLYSFLPPRGLEHLASVSVPHRPKPPTPLTADTDHLTFNDKFAVIPRRFAASWLGLLDCYMGGMQGATAERLLRLCVERDGVHVLEREDIAHSVGAVVDGRVCARVNQDDAVRVGGAEWANAQSLLLGSADGLPFCPDISKVHLGMSKLGVELL